MGSLPAGITWRLRLPSPERALLHWSCDWSGDGSRFVAVGRGAEVWDIDRTTWTAGRRGIIGGMWSGVAAWSPTEPDVLAYLSRGRTELYHLAIAGDEALWLHEGNPARAYRESLGFAPAGDRIALAGETEQIEILDAGSGRTVSTLTSPIAVEQVFWSPGGQNILVAGPRGGLRDARRRRPGPADGW